MSIVSLKFVAFAAILVAAYFLAPKRWQWKILLAASAIFYALNGIQSILFIAITIATQYCLGLALEKKNEAMAAEIEEKKPDARQKKEIRSRYSSSKKKYVVISLAVNFGLFLFLKYFDKAIGKANAWFGLGLKPLGILVPLGLSYYTFKAVGYVIDVYRGRIHAQKNIGKLALFVSYFPALVQGPIDRYEDVTGELFAEHEFDYRRFCFGMQRMLWGYMKKMIVAERAAVIINTVQTGFAAQGYEGFTVFIAMALTVFRTYADFSGGMDIVIGFSEIFGIPMTENFRQPFFSKSIAEFWQRWHITLGAWMRTYVFYPLSLSPAFSKLGRACRKKIGDRYGKLIAPTIASFVTFFLVGMWHGIGRSYLPFSLYNAALVASATLLEDVYAKIRERLHLRENSKAYRAFQSVRTTFLAIVANYLILTKTPDMVGIIKATFQRWNPWVFFDRSLYSLGLDQRNFLLMLWGIVIILFVDFLHERGIRIREAIARQNIVVRWAIYYGALFALIIFGMYGPDYNAASFIYENF